MNLRLTPRALADAKRMKTWWRRYRPKAPELFEQELEAALERIAIMPTLGSVYDPGDLAVEVRRLLMPKTRNHVYYAVSGNDLSS